MRFNDGWKSDMLRSMQFLAARTAHQFASADRLATISKFLFLGELIEHLKIDLVLDVGANVGQFAADVRRLGYGGALVSFEPVPEAYAALGRVMAGDKTWSGHNIAVGDVEGEAHFHVMQASSYSSFRSPTHDQGGWNTIKATIPVQVRRLDSIMRDVDLRRTLLKVDTQGFEMEVFRGLGDRLGDIRAIVCEVSVMPVYDGMPLIGETMSFLDAAGFKPAFFSPIGRRHDYSSQEFDYVCTNVRPASALE